MHYPDPGFSDMNKFAVIVAGGSGTRMGNNTPKQFLPLRQKPVVWHTLATFLQAFEDLQIILVLPEAYISTGQELIQTLPANHRIRITAGGDTRFHSVRNGLALVDQPSVVFVHDAVRCLLSVELIHTCYNEAMQHGNAIPAVPSVDSLRVITGDSNNVIDRETVRQIQTPQTFRSELLCKAFEQPYDPLFTDEASVVEQMGVTIHLVEGEPTNLKITRPLDLLFAEKILEQKETEQ